MTEVDRLGWAVTIPMRAGEYVLGVRANTTALGGLLRDLFRERIVDVADPPGNLSLLLAPRSESNIQDLHRLYVTYTRVLSSRSAIRGLEALWHELDVRDGEVEPHRMQVAATALVREGQAYLLPARARGRILAEHRRWQAAGFCVVDRRLVDLDPAAGTIHVPRPDLTPASGTLADRVAQLDLLHRDEPTAPAGTLPIASWVLPSAQASLAGRVGEAATQVVDRTAYGAALLGGLASLLRELPELSWTTEPEVRARLVSRP